MADINALHVPYYRNRFHPGTTLAEREAMVKAPQRHRIATLLYADDDALRAMGLRELRAALKRADSRRGLAKALGVHERTVQRWIEDAGLGAEAPDGRYVVASDDRVKDVVRGSTSLSEAAERLGLSLTGLRSRAERIGIDTPDGRRKR